MRLQVESEVVVFALGSTRQRLPTARAADSIAPRIPPGQADLCNGATVSRCNEEQVIK